MRWFVATLIRFAQLLGVWLVLLSCCCGGGIEDGDLVTPVHNSLFVSTGLLVFVEWQRTRAAQRALSRELAEALRPEPTTPTVPLWIHGALVILTFTGWYAWYGLTSPDIHRLALESPLLALIQATVRALTWTGATASVAVLLHKGLLLGRQRWAARNPTRPVKRRRPTALPLTVAAISSCALLAIVVCRPGGEWLGVAARVAAASLPEPGAASLLPAPDPAVEFLLTVAPGSSLTDVEVVAAIGARAERAFPHISSAVDAELGATFVITLQESSQLGFLLATAVDRDVHRVELDSAVLPVERGSPGSMCAGSVALPVNDPLAATQTTLEEVGGGAALHALAGHRPRRLALVAIVDTGIDGYNEDLGGVLVPFPASDDLNGHGTATAGVAAAIANNGYGLASLNDRGAFLRVRSYPALAGPRPAADDVARAIWDAAEDDADVINLSLGGVGVAPRVVVRAVEHALASGSVVVASAGNGGGDAANHWPANIPGVLVVGGTRNGKPGPTSNLTLGARHRVWAPGHEVCTLGPGGSYSKQTGTSVAAPLVSGLIGTLRALCPGISVAEARSLVEESGESVGWMLGNEVRADVALQRLFLLPSCVGGLPAPRERVREPDRWDTD